MHEILKHLNGQQQYKLLQNMFIFFGVFNEKELKNEMPQTIQKIMDEVNK